MKKTFLKRIIDKLLTQKLMKSHATTQFDKPVIGNVLVETMLIAGYKKVVKNVRSWNSHMIYINDLSYLGLA